jgi:hypothetical protein
MLVEDITARVDTPKAPAGDSRIRDGTMLLILTMVMTVYREGLVVIVPRDLLLLLSVLLVSEVDISSCSTRFPSCIAHIRTRCLFVLSLSPIGVSHPRVIPTYMVSTTVCDSLLSISV